MLIDENSSISILIQRLFHLIGVLINYFTLTNGKTQFLLAKLIDGVSFPVLITQKKKEHCLEDLTITKDCIRKRVTRKRLVCARNPGAESPMKAIEEYLVSILNQMAKMRQPLCISEGLALAKSLVELLYKEG